MKNVRFFILLISMVFLVACGDPVMHASSYEMMTSSYKNMLHSLPDNEKQPFIKAYNSIVYSYQNHIAFREKGDTREVIQQRLEHLIDGMNASQIIGEYKKLRRKRALWDIHKLEKEILKKEDDKKQLDLVTIRKYKLYLQKDGKLDRMFLDMVVYNGSKYNLKSISFLIRVGSSYSDTVLPQKRDILLMFPNGLESGKEAFKKIDLGYPSIQRYLPKEPLLSEYSTSGIRGDKVDIVPNIYPTLSDLNRRLNFKKANFQKEFGEYKEARR